MGVKSYISLKELNNIFKSYNFISLIPTSSGIMDTTYIANTQNNSYILKKYERDLKATIISNAKVLHQLKSIGLNVSVLLDAEKNWYIYEKLDGKEPKLIKTTHIQSLARFLAKMHNFTNKKSLEVDFIQKNDIKI